MWMDQSLQSIFLHGAVRESRGPRVSRQLLVFGDFATFLKDSRYYTGPVKNALYGDAVGGLERWLSG